MVIFPFLPLKYLSKFKETLKRQQPDFGMNSKSTKKVDNICAISPLQVAKIYLNIVKKYVTIFNSELLRVFFTSYCM